MSVLMCIFIVYLFFHMLSRCLLYLFLFFQMERDFRVIFVNAYAEYTYMILCKVCLLKSSHTRTIMLFI